MSEVPRTDYPLERSEGYTAEQLLPVVYDELQKLAASKMAREAPGHSLQTTGLVHEAYIRLVDVDNAQRWNSRGHFFGAAAQAMRRILVEVARSNRRQRNGGDRTRVDLDEGMATPSCPIDELLDVRDALESLAETDEQTAKMISLRYFAGLSIAEVADVLGISPRTVDYRWADARACLREKLDSCN